MLRRLPYYLNGLPRVSVNGDEHIVVDYGGQRKVWLFRIAGLGLPDYPEDPLAEGYVDALDEWRAATKRKEYGRWMNRSEWSALAIARATAGAENVDGTGREA